MATALKLKNDIKKLKAALKSKATPKAYVPKLETQLKAAEAELKQVQSGVKPKRASSTKKTEATLSALQKLIKKKGYEAYRGAGVDLKRDAREGAMKAGRRVSKGLKANQYGSQSDNKGNVYYEYRPNHIDVKQPKRKQTYPKLEKGAELPKKKRLKASEKQYNKEVDAYNWYVVDLENKKAVSGWEFKEDAKEALSDYDGDKNFKVVSERQLKLMGVSNPKETWKYDGGGFTKGNMEWTKAEVGDSAVVISENKIGLIVKPYGRKFHLRFPDGSEKTYDASELKFIFDDDDYASGGYMADGGSVKYKKGQNYLINKNGEEKRIILMKNVEEGRFVHFVILDEKGNRIYNEPTLMDYDKFEKSIVKKLPSGGYMARGGYTAYNTGRSWAADRRGHNKKEAYEIPMKDRKYYYGGEVGEGFTITEMKEHLRKLFPDSFGFKVRKFSEQGDEGVNSAVLLPDDSNYYGLEDKDVQSKLYFPQYKRDHDIRFRIYQGGENTYFSFVLYSEKDDEYVGEFGFKDRGEVPANYITKFISFLMEKYGLPFEVKHSVMEHGGELHRTQE
jgi:hypothetical protein